MSHLLGPTGQLKELQWLSVWCLSPEHGSPPLAGFGLSHARILCLFPPPQVTEQVDQCSQCPQLPLTLKNKLLAFNHENFEWITFDLSYLMVIPGHSSIKQCTAWRSTVSPLHLFPFPLYLQIRFCCFIPWPHVLLHLPSSSHFPHSPST